VKNRTIYRLNNLAHNNLESELRVYTQCPSDRFPEKDKNGNEIKKPNCWPSNSLLQMDNLPKNKIKLQRSSRSKKISTNKIYASIQSALMSPTLTDCFLALYSSHSSKFLII
jgi:hypothetical protein